MNWFIRGYEDVKRGRVRDYLTPRQARRLYPQQIDTTDTTRYLNGMDDALAGDPWRYNIQVRRERGEAQQTIYADLYGEGEEM